MQTKWRVDTMGVDGKWHHITSGVGMTVYYYTSFQSAKTEAVMVAESENIQTRIMQIDERELEIIASPARGALGRCPAEPQVKLRYVSE